MALARSFSPLIAPCDDDGGALVPVPALVLLKTTNGRNVKLNREYDKWVGQSKVISRTKKQLVP